MKTAKVSCGCGRTVAFFKEFVELGSFQEKEFDKMRAQGYTVEIGEDLSPSPPCLEPCQDRPDCAFRKSFSTDHGFMAVYEC